MGLMDLATYVHHLSGGLRPNQFSVNLSAPAEANLDGEKFSALVSAVNLPMMTTGVIQKKKRGRQIKLSGDIEPSGQWTVKVDLNSGKQAAHALHMALAWQRLAQVSKDPLTYKTNGEVQVIDASLSEVELPALKAEVLGVWIANVTEIQLDDESVDEVLSFEITFEYDEVIYL